MSAQLDALRSYVGTRRAVGAAGARGGDVAPRVVVVGSGRGGVGTSVTAALLALSVAALGRSVLLVDADEHVGPLRYLLGVPMRHALGALRGGVDVDALLVPVSATLTLLPGGPSPDGDATPSAMHDAPVTPAERRALLRRVAALYPRYDLVVVDGGSRLDTVSACCDAALAGPLGDATRLAVVASEDAIGLASAYALVKAVAQRAPGIATDVLAARQDAPAATHAFAQLEEATQHFLQRPLRLLGAVPNDGSLDVALRAGMPLQDAAAGSPAAVAVHDIALTLVDPPAAARPRVPHPSALPAYGSAR